MKYNCAETKQSPVVEIEQKTLIQNVLFLKKKKEKKKNWIRGREFSEGKLFCRKIFVREVCTYNFEISPQIKLFTSFTAPQKIAHPTLFCVEGGINAIDVVFFIYIFYLGLYFALIKIYEWIQRRFKLEMILR